MGTFDRGKTFFLSEQETKSIVRSVSVTLNNLIYAIWHCLDELFNVGCLICRLAEIIAFFGCHS